MMRPLLEVVKTMVRPVARHRFLIEKAKYVGQHIYSPQEGNDRISECIHRPGMVGKIGGTEMKLLRTFRRRCDRQGECHNFGRYAWWAYVSSGIYPQDSKLLSRFCREYPKCLSNLDLLAVWFNFGEARARRQFAPQAELLSLTSLEPFFHEHPWSAQLAGKRVVVVTPFELSTRRQYERRAVVWRSNPEVLPEFKSLRIVRCPHLAGLIDTPEYPDWFAGLDALKGQLAAESFDVAIIGAGAWSLPLAAHAKSLGAFGIHMGGATQLLFGIVGNRWRNQPAFQRFFNDAWAAPSEDERPKKFKLQENGCYW